MKSVYTGYFARLRSYGDVRPVSIARFSPKWYEGDRLPQVAPSTELLREYKEGLLTEEDYEERYLEELNALNLHKEILLPLKKVLDNDDRDVVLLCYERVGDFCHRHIFARWMNERIPNLIKGERL